MKIVFLVAILAFTFPVFANETAQTNPELEAVIATTYNYFHGLHRGDQPLLKRTFDMSSGNMKYVNDGKLTAEALESFSKYFTKSTDEQWNGEILAVDIVDDKIAFVKFDFDTPKVHYIDFLILFKVEGEWVITTKAYVANDK